MSTYLEARPDLFSSVAPPALDTAPLRILPQLLTRAIGDDRPLNSTLGHPLRTLQDWIKAAVPGEGDAVHRRKILLDALLAWHARGSADEVVCLRALSIVFTPAFEDTERDPVDLSSYTLRFGCLVAGEVAALRSLWSRALPLLHSCGIAHWDSLRELIHHWAYPESGRGGPASREVAEEMRDFARQMSEDVLAVAGEHPGVRQWVASLASRMGWEIDVPVDREFAILFPDRDRGKDLHESFRKQYDAAIALADEWAQETPVVVAERFARFEQAATFVGHRWPVFTEQVAERIAAFVPDPFPWSDALLATAASHAVVGPFLRRALHDALPGWEDLWEACYRQSRLRGMAILAAVKDEGTSPEILEKALSDLSGLADALGTEALRHELPEHRLRLLLGHPDQRVATEVAWGVWHADPEGSVPEGLRDAWRSAVITGDMEHSYTLRQIFESDPAIASGWLVNRIARGSDGYWRWPDDDPLPSAFGSLDASQRRALLDQLSSESTDVDLVRELVGRDADVFRALLANPRLQAWHLSPLAGEPDGEWIPLAVAALDAGYTAQEVAEAAYGIMPGWEGRESTFWHSWADRFRALEEQEDVRLREVGRIGREDAEASEARAAAAERDREVTGRWRR